MDEIDRLRNPAKLQGKTLHAGTNNHLKKEAYETFCDLREQDSNLQAIIDYFASV